MCRVWALCDPLNPILEVLTHSQDWRVFNIIKTKVTGTQWSKISLVWTLVSNLRSKRIKRPFSVPALTTTSLFELKHQQVLKLWSVLEHPVSCNLVRGSSELFNANLLFILYYLSEAQVLSHENTPITLTGHTICFPFKSISFLMMLQSRSYAEPANGSWFLPTL